jgi:hypothetical protein
MRVLIAFLEHNGLHSLSDLQRDLDAYDMYAGAGQPIFTKSQDVSMQLFSDCFSGLFKGKNTLLDPARFF